MKIIRIITLVTLLLIMAIFSWSRLSMHVTVDGVGKDFAAYWASGHLLLFGEDPYSAEKVLAVQKSIGWPKNEPAVIYNPPWVLTILLPFCMLDFATGKIMWLACMLALILFCADRLWLLYGGPPEKRLWALLAVLSFSPVFISYRMGQIVPLALLGLVGFLQGVRDRSWWLAGAALVLLAIKPHALYLIWMALLLWMIRERRWQILACGSLLLLVSMLPPLFYNPDIIIQYFENILTKSYAVYWRTPTIGTFLRLAFHPHYDWLQYVPTILGGFWFIFYWRAHRNKWIWEAQLPHLIFASIVTIFYSWPFDYLMILPAVIQSAVKIIREPLVGRTGWLLVFYATINIAAVVINYLPSFEWYVWMPFALWLNYALLHTKRNSNEGICLS